MTSVVVDAVGMRGAARALDRYLDAIELARRRLNTAEVPAGLSHAQRSLVERALEAARLDLLGAMRAVAGRPDDLRHRAAYAETADLPLALTNHAVGMFASSFSASVPSRSALVARAIRDESTMAGIRANYREAAKAADGLAQSVPTALRHGSKAVGGLGNLGAAAYSNFNDPMLSTSQKVGRTGAALATGTGVSALSGAAAGAMFGSAAGPAGFLVGAGAGMAWSVADSKLGVSEHIGDAAADVIDVGDSAVDQVGDGAEAVADTLSEGFKQLGL